MHKKKGRTHTRRGAPIVIAVQKRLGRVKRAARRAFIVSNGEPITSRDVLERAYPRLNRFDGWHRWSAHRALSEFASIVGRNRFGRGRPNLWRHDAT
jgi:hypothetical protein